MWRTPSLGENLTGKFHEALPNLEDPAKWGWGSFIYEPIKKDSPQYNWLQEELSSPEFKAAKYKIVMFHHQYHSLGGNNVPALTDPIQEIVKDETGKVTAVRYEYPMDKDYLTRDIVPLLKEGEVDLVYYGHSHLWNRFFDEIHFLESSMVGNTYGAYARDKKRWRIPPVGYKEDYAASGNPYGGLPIVPGIAPRGDNDPFIADNNITVFSILDTGTGTVSSYYYDVTKTGSDVVKFDEFPVKTLGE